MSPGPQRVLALAIGAIALAVIGLQTSEALRAAGPWRPRAAKPTAVSAPYARLERVLAQAESGEVPSTLRDPFSYGAARPIVPTGPTTPRIVRPSKPVAPPAPVVTAIVSDADPRAILVFEGRNYMVKPGDSFAGFQVISMTPESVVLESNGQRLVIRLASKGE
ncbi:MAG: hypothetical protein HOP12_00495 [Candidatus Eisenbacteria bacterium]|uniref:Uncharacterized protein n=1 Tax=Eiseniibacteriota bacterium TaxID=2212470 RepID=A0A849SMH0_UNCEI|nr:hypothetical protein [Candidatus Eisenbacteria bacterium]